jgi:hypothetical protein
MYFKYKISNIKNIKKIAVEFFSSDNFSLQNTFPTLIFMKRIGEGIFKNLSKFKTAIFKNSIKKKFKKAGLTAYGKANLFQVIQPIFLKCFHDKMMEKSKIL